MYTLLLSLTYSKAIVDIKLDFVEKQKFLYLKTLSSKVVGKSVAELMLRLCGWA